MKRLAVGPIATPEYIEWWEIIKQDFKRKNAELEKKIEQIEEGNMNLRQDMYVQKLEIEKLRKGNNKAEEDFDTLKTDYKRLRCSMKAAGLGKLQSSGIKKFKRKRSRLIDGKGSFRRPRCEM
ncbi:hypothetical protein Goshw_026259, partial [Gossypium schwendimanii]|nr:hypothetical protein [Gossypium schwendimanii]